MTRKHKILSFALIFLVIFALVPFASAYHSFSERETETTRIDTTKTFYVNTPYGYERKTVRSMETIRKTSNSPSYYSGYFRPAYSTTKISYDTRTSGQKYYYDYDYSGYPSTNFRYRQVYNSGDYSGNKYTDSYYYAPKFDSSLGHYNWRY